MTDNIVVVIVSFSKRSSAAQRTSLPVQIKMKNGQLFFSIHTALKIDKRYVTDMDEFICIVPVYDIEKDTDRVFRYIHLTGCITKRCVAIQRRRTHGKHYWRQ